MKPRSQTSPSWRLIEKRCWPFRGHKTGAAAMGRGKVWRFQRRNFCVPSVLTATLRRWLVFWVLQKWPVWNAALVIQIVIQRWSFQQIARAPCFSLNSSQQFQAEVNHALNLEGPRVWRGSKIDLFTDLQRNRSRSQWFLHHVVSNGNVMFHLHLPNSTCPRIEKSFRMDTKRLEANKKLFSELEHSVFCLLGKLGQDVFFGNFNTNHQQ